MESKVKKDEGIFAWAHNPDERIVIPQNENVISENEKTTKNTTSDEIINLGKVTINAEFVLEIKDSESLIETLSCLEKKLSPNESHLFIDKNGNVITNGDDFLVVEQIQTYPIKAYLVKSLSASVKK